jgi:hypothetical protein
MGRRDYPAFALSGALHVLGVLMVAWVLLHNPIVIQDPLSRNYKVRHLELDRPDTAASRAAEALYPNRKQAGQANKSEAIHPAKSGEDQAAKAETHGARVPPLSLPEGGRGKQVLMQPEIKQQVAVAAEVPLPSLLVWTPESKKVIEIHPPAPEKPSTANVQTSLELPNEELQLASLPQTSSDRTPKITTAPAGSSSPVAVKATEEAKMAPATAAKPTSDPTPAAILSVSDMRMDKGTINMPPVNETKGSSNKDGIQQAAHPGETITQNGIGDPARATVDGSQAAVVADAEKSAQNDLASGETAEHIQLPKDGKFGVVVVGSSLSDQYPETLEVWSDRVAYTAYIHVGTPKAWILQYAQLRSADASAGGTVAHLDAPWPYDIVRPNLLSKDLNADALMVHGVLNETGHLVNLAIAYPQGYVHASYVLYELQKWQFRPAQQKGKPTAVEVLLIIPENE